MSGIAAAYGKIAGEEVQNILKKISHRGPDNIYIYESINFTIGEAFLSLSPEDTGARNDEISREHFIALDGRIYNHNELNPRPEKNKSDRKLVLELFNNRGIDFLTGLDGMFAMALTVDGKFFAARDPLGIKPFYYGYNNGIIYFASEIKALDGFASGIKIFPPGHYFTPEEGFKKYIDFTNIQWKETSLEEAVNNVNSLLEESVTRQIPAGTTPASLLSGGIDSSIIAAIASRHVDNLKTFCVGMEGASDLDAARRASEYIGSDHREFTYNKKDIKDILPRVIYHMESFDPSLVRSSVANFFAYKLIGDSARVVFSGEGGDELFGGYSYLKEIEEKDKLHRKLIGFFYNLHNVGLQRVDRMSSAHSKECRMPFLGMDLLNYVTTLTPAWKIHGTEKTEKWVLRKAFEGYIPPELLWRVKQEFSQGSGTVEVMAEIAGEEISDSTFEKERYAVNPPLRSKEELMHYRIFKEYFKDESAVNTVGRWVTE